MIETFDESGKPILIVGPDVSKSDAALRLGKDEDGTSVSAANQTGTTRRGAVN